MFLIETEKALLDAFRPHDRKHVEIPTDMKFPLKVRDYHAWVEPSGVRVFLLFAEEGSRKAVGIVFRRDQSAGASASRMCDWCHSHGPSSEIGLITATADSRKRVGITACLDLSCGSKIETEAHLNGSNPRLLSYRLLGRMAQFARQSLF